MQHRTWTYLNDSAHACSKDIAHGLRPHDRRSQLSDKVLLDNLGVVDRLASDILVNWADALVEGSLLDGFGKLQTGGLHQRAMESATHTQRHHTLGTGFLQLFGSSIHTLHRTRDDQLARTIVVGGNHHSILNGGTHFLDERILGSDDSGHRTRLSFASFLHGHGTLTHQAQAVFKAKHLIGDKSRKLTQGMTRHHGRIKLFEH